MWKGEATASKSGGGKRVSVRCLRDVRGGSGEVPGRQLLGSSAVQGLDQ